MKKYIIALGLTGMLWMPALAEDAATPHASTPAKNDASMSAPAKSDKSDAKKPASKSSMKKAKKKSQKM